MSKRQLKRPDYPCFQVEIKSFESSEEIGGTYIEGFASTPDVDRYDDIVEPKAFHDAFVEYAKNPVILAFHDTENPIGLMEDGKITDNGLYIKALIVDEPIERKIKARILRGFSIGFKPTVVVFRHKDTQEEIDYERYSRLPWEEMSKYWRVIKELDLAEISVVSVPANPNTLFTLEKSISEYFVKNFNPSAMPNKDNSETNEEVKEVPQEEAQETNEEVSQPAAEQDSTEMPAESAGQEEAEGETSEEAPDESVEPPAEGEEKSAPIMDYKAIAIEATNALVAMKSQLEAKEAEISSLKAQIDSRPVFKGIAFNQSGFVTSEPTKEEVKPEESKGETPNLNKAISGLLYQARRQS